jgi:acetyl-CoA acetyltransferase
MTEAVVLGVGMHPWGKWGKPFVTYGITAAQNALADAGIQWTDVDFVSGAETVRNGYPGYVSAATFAQALGWNGTRVATSYAACASGATALEVARAQIRSGRSKVALVIGADTTPKGFLAPNAGERPDDPDWLRFRFLGATNPAYFALYARRRMALYGDTPEHFATVRVKNALGGVNNPNARYRKALSVDDVLASPIVANPLHLLEICATSDGAAAVILTTEEFARTKRSDIVRVAAVSTATPTFPSANLELPDIATDSAAVVSVPAHSFRQSLGVSAYDEAGVSPSDVDVAEVYDLSSAMELDWYEDLQFCARGEGAKLVESGDTALGGRIPVNPSGGLASFGEAVPAQALAQVCELTWQLRGQAEGRQVEGARVGITANQGLFGHGSSVILTR